MESQTPYIPLLKNECLKFKAINTKAILTSEQKDSVNFKGIFALTTRRVLFLNQNYTKAF